MKPLSERDAQRLVEGSTPVGVVADVGPADLLKSIPAVKAREAAKRRASRRARTSKP